MTKIMKLFLAIMCPLFAPALVWGQAKQDFYDAFSGEWIIFDTSYSSGGAPCSVVLEADVTPNTSVNTSAPIPRASSNNCVSPLASIANWDIEQGQLVFYSGSGEVVARLGGNQVRVTGDLENSLASLVLERIDGSSYQTNFSKALKRHGCIYLGYTSDCALPEQLSVPSFSKVGESNLPVTILAQLNVREQPRRDSFIVGKLPENSCLNINFCTVASDGVWCRADFGDQTGWISRNVLRQNEWPVATFVNGCSEEEVKD